VSPSRGNPVNVHSSEPVRARSTGLGPVLGPPLSARTCERSITAFDQSSRSAHRNSASSSSCSRCHAPALRQSHSRRQHVIPDPKPNSCGRNSHGIRTDYPDPTPQTSLRYEFLADDRSSSPQETTVARWHGHTNRRLEGA
jgi:hypothetical protein